MHDVEVAIVMVVGIEETVKDLETGRNRNPQARCQGQMVLVSYS